MQQVRVVLLYRIRLRKSCFKVNGEVLLNTNVINTTSSLTDTQSSKT